MRRLACCFICAVAAAACGDGNGPPPPPEGLITLGVGEVKTIALSDAAPMLISGGSAGAEFTLIPVNALEDARATIALELSGEKLTTAAGPPTPRLGTLGAARPIAAVDATFPATAASFEAGLRRLEREELTSRIPGARAVRMARARSRIPGRATFLDVPTVGAEMVINISTSSACGAPRLHTGHVAAISEHAVIVSDDANPAGGYTDAEYAEIGREFDALVHPVIVENFGEATDIDANGRIVIFFTRAVNELAPFGSTGFVSGFTFGRDLFPKAGADGCAGSNEAELVYAMVPDPQGEANGRVFAKDFVRGYVIADQAYHYQQVVNMSRHILVNNAPNLEESWLGTALSNIATELVFYRASGLGPRGNITSATLESSPTIREAANAHQRPNLLRLVAYLLDPESRSPYGEDDGWATRGAAWQLLRYLADRSTIPERTLWSNLVNSQATGIANIEGVTGADFSTLVREWAVAQYTDDAGFEVAPAFRHASWSFRSVLPPLRQDAAFPLRTHALAPGAPLPLTLAGGGAAYVRFGVAAKGIGTVRVITTGGTLGDLSLTVVRTK